MENTLSSGDTPLHTASEYNNIEVVRILLERKADFDLKNKKGERPFDVTRSSEIKRLLMHHMKQQDYQELMKEPGVKQKKCKLFLCGYAAVGKSTLTKSLQGEKCPTSDHDPTPGIDVNTVKIRSKDGSHEEFSSWDLAGQPVYYVTHNMFIAAVYSTFILLYIIADEENGKLVRPKTLKESQKEKVLTWLRFIKATNASNQQDSNTASGPSAKPSVILVASRADLVKPNLKYEAEAVADEILKEAQEKFGKYFDISDKRFILNCKDIESDEMQRLRNLLCEIKISKARMMPYICEEILEQKDKWITDERFPVMYWTNYVKAVKSISERNESFEDDFLRNVTSYIHDMGEDNFG
ncbi:death-associated protein kinase 1-like [Glandiceps talaboti]